MRGVLGSESSLVALDSILSELETAGDSLAMAEQVLGSPTSFLERSHGGRYTLNCEIGGGLLLMHPNGVVIFPDAVIGPNCQIFKQVTIGVGASRPEFSLEGADHMKRYTGPSPHIPRITVRQECQLQFQAPKLSPLQRNTVIPKCGSFGRS